MRIQIILRQPDGINVSQKLEFTGYKVCELQTGGNNEFLTVVLEPDFKSVTLASLIPKPRKKK